MSFLCLWWVQKNVNFLKLRGNWLKTIRVLVLGIIEHKRVCLIMREVVFPDRNDCLNIKHQPQDQAITNKYQLILPRKRNLLQCILGIMLELISLLILLQPKKPICQAQALIWNNHQYEAPKLLVESLVDQERW